MVKILTPESCNLTGVSISPTVTRSPEEDVVVSIKTLLHVLNNSKAKKSHRLVLIEIANHVNEKNGLAWPSYQTLADKTGFTRRRVIDLVAELKALGEVEIVPHGSPTGGPAYRVRGSKTMPLPAQMSSEIISP